MLKDKVIVITGGAGRIGSEFAKSVIENSGIAIIADINEDFANKTIERISKELEEKKCDISSKILFFNIDISSKKSIKTLIENLHKEFGKIDALVNNAYPRSRNYGKKFFEIEMEDFNEFLNLHLGGYFNISQHFIKYFLEQKYGNIVNI